MTAAALRVDAVSKAYGDHTVLDHVDLVVPQGSTTAVLGASGCGKTTLLRLVAGFETPGGGTITVGGHTVAGDTTSVAPHRRNVGYVAQDGALFPHLTVAQNVAYGLRGVLRGPEKQVRVETLLDMVSLDPALARRRPHELSGGQQQRVALARALARNPALMLLDEPFSALDTGLRASTRKAVSKTLADAAVATLLVTHDQEEALSIADQVAVLRDGRFTQIGSPAAVYRNPVDRFTARFLGECVFLPATVNSTRAHCVLGAIPVHGAHPSGSATIMLRPEQLTARVLSPTDDGSAAGTVLSAEFLGSDVLLTIALPGDVAPITVRQSSIDAPVADDKVGLEIAGAAIVFGDGR